MTKAPERGMVGAIHFRVRWISKNWRAEISADGASWVRVVTESKNKDQQLDAVIRGAIYANNNPHSLRSCF